MRRRETIEEQMARVKQNQKPATVRTTSTSRGVRTRSRSATAVLTVSAIAALWAGTMLTGAGQTAYAYGFFFTEFFAGVIALVALSLTVMLGLLATDRLVLLIRHRVLLQSAHRATGILGVAGLFFHVLTKVATGRAASTDAIVPFVGGGGLYVGLGTVAGLLMVSVLWTGIVRARFAGVGPKWLWRALHSTAYLSWPFAILHGLNAGRPAKSWVVLSYLACVLLVVLALLVRLSVTFGRRSREQHQAAAMNQALAARPAEDGRGRALLGGLSRRRADGAGRDSSWAETTLAGTWAAPGAKRRDPERFTVPVVPEPGSLREPVRPARRRDEDLAPVARRRRTGEREAVARRREDELEPTARRRREEEPQRRATRRRGEEPAPAERRSRRAGEPARAGRRRDEELTPTGRRRRTEEDLAPTGRRVRDDEELAPTGRRRRGDEESGRVSRRSRVDAEAGTRYSVPPRSNEPEEPWDSPRRWEATEPISAGPISAGPISAGPISAGPVSAGPISGGPISGGPISAAPRSGGGRHSVEDDVPEEPDYWRPPARYVPEEVPADDTPTLVDLASRRARREAKESRRRRRANADAVDGAYWAGLRGEAR
ncbi:hypothetical protein Q3W71_09195 [Micromonospora sp. C28SCA-DRY-2]|uniref:hypothetical protein n=1 Tax=Micromonospora sp. C28SCA-DRY-2 TaxID=3059522 RepID=UPI0026751568|nr:hypothetical protein [Micromonospora sp. C28SCA-DRY-2]MDO3701855.1 hypothetical protein [Micromonospora sp. C28SCA-DRY-2]